MITAPPYVAVVLAGGAARRMEGIARNGLKTLLPLAGKPVLEHVCSALRHNVPAPKDIALNVLAGQIPDVPDMPIAPDATEDRQGPLAGIAAGLHWCTQQHPEVRWLLSVSGDTPFLPPDLAQRLLGAALEQNTLVACAASGARTHPTIALWSVSLRARLKTALAQNIRKIERFSSTYSPAIVEWQIHDDDPFFNINRPEDLRRAENKKILKSKGKM